MKTNLLVILLLLIFTQNTVYSQSGTCSGALPFSTGIDYSYPASTDTDAEIGPDYGCLATQPNPAWYYLQIDQGGSIDIHINSCPGTFDIDFICWGPFTNVTCDYSMLSQANTIDCSFSSSFQEDCNIPNGVAGEYYMFLITNYSNAETNICFSQTGGTGSTSDTFVQNCNIYNVTATPTACDTINNSYEISGSVSFLYPPTTGSLVVEDNETGAQQIFNAPFTNPQNFTITGLLSDGATHTVTSYFTDSTNCSNQTTYTAPSTCVTCNAYSNETTVCNSYIDLFVDGAFGDGNWTAETPGGIPITDVVYVDPNNPDNPNPKTSDTVRAFVTLTGASETVVFVWEQAYGSLTCSDSVTITFYAGPGAEGGNDLYIVTGCGNYSVNLEAEAPVIGTGWWSSFETGVNFSDTLDNNATVSVTNNFFQSSYVDTLDIVWNVQNAGCMSSDIVRVVFYQKPEANAGLDTFACGRDFTFTPEVSLDSIRGEWNLISGASSMDLSWYPINQTEPNTTVNYTGSLTEPITITFEWIEKHPINETCLDRDTINVTFYPTPFIEAGEQNSYCGINGQLAAVGSLGYGTWHTAGIGNFTFSDITNPNTTFVNNSGSGIYTLYWRETVQTNFSSSCIVQDSVVIIFAETPVISYTSIEETNIVCGNAESLNISSPNAEYYYWEDLTYSGTEFVNVSPTTDSVYVEQNGTHQFIFTALNTMIYNQDTLECESNEMFTFSFKEMPQPYAGPDDTVCVTGSDYYYPLQGVKSLDESSTTITWICVDPQLDFASTGTNYSSTIDDLVKTDVMGQWKEITLIERYNDQFGSCPVQDKVNLYFSEIPEANAVFEMPNCSGDIIEVKEQNDVYNDYSWEFSGESIVIDSTSNLNGAYGTYYIQWIDDNINHEVYLSVEDNYKCWSANDTLNINYSDLTNTAYNETEYASICGGETYTFRGQTYNTSGTYTELYTSEAGCDSTIALVLTVNPEYNETITEYISEGETYTFGTQILSNPGNYANVFNTVSGCDSTVFLTLIVNTPYNGTITASICEGDTYSFETLTLDSSGTYTELYTSENGNDSTITLILTVNPVYYDTITASFCEGETYTFGSEILDTAGTYTETFTSEQVCDSTVILTLISEPLPTINSNPISQTITTSSDATFSIVTNGTNDTYQWRKDEVSLSDIPGIIDGSSTDSITIFNITENFEGSYDCVVTNICGLETISDTAMMHVSIGNNIKDSDIRIYPNPANDKITVITNGASIITILNINGQVILQTPLNDKNTIDISELANGLYIVKIASETANFIEKLVIEK